MKNSLTVVTYHYVRDLPRTRFPRINGFLTEDFRQQVDFLRNQHEMATLDSALDFISGKYVPERDLCLLTFDDGFKEHFAEVTPILSERRIQGIFFPPTWCVEEQRVASVHKNHFLMAALPFADYRRAFLDALAAMHPEVDTAVDPIAARTTYRLDSSEHAVFKYLLNFGVAEPIRDRVLNRLFQEFLGDEKEFAKELYLSWEDARAMQAEGMLFGGHSHRHTALAILDHEKQQRDLETCSLLLRQRLRPQPLWPFSFPYGRPYTYTEATVAIVRSLGFCCAFTTIVGLNSVGQDIWHIPRLDTRDVQWK